MKKMEEIGNNNNSEDSQYLRVEPKTKETVTLLSLKIDEPQEEGYSATIKVRHGKSDKNLNLPKVLRGKIESAIKDKVVKVGSIVVIENKGKVKPKKGKNSYFDFTLYLKKK